MDNDVCKSLIREGNIEYEQPNIVELEGLDVERKS